MIGLRHSSSVASLGIGLIVVAQLVPLALGLHVSGNLPDIGSFNEYVGKFCFGYDPDGGIAGMLDVTVSGILPDQDLYLLLFDDEQKHWTQARKDWDSLTCDELISFASGAHRVSSPSGVFEQVVRIRERLRPRYWYFSFAACGSNIMESLTYDIHLVNPQLGFQQEFGIDEEGSLWLQLMAAVLFLCMMIGTVYAAKKAGSGATLRSRPILRLSIFSAFFCSFGALCRALHFLMFAFDGRGLGVLDVLGQLWICVGKALIAFQLMLTAKGWSFFYAKEEFVQRRRILIIMGLLLVTTAACEIHADWSLDWSPTLYMYETWSGRLVLLLNALLFLEAGRSMYKTYKGETSEEVRNFYTMVSAAASIYFLSVPVLCVCSALLRPWVRFKYVDRIEVLSRFVATALMAWSIRPSHLDAMITGRLEEHFERDAVHDTEEDELCGSNESADGVA